MKKYINACVILIRSFHFKILIFIFNFIQIFYNMCFKSITLTIYLFILLSFLIKSITNSTNLNVFKKVWFL
jgi:uncharacterized membrane protein